MSPTIKSKELQGGGEASMIRWMDEFCRKELFQVAIKDGLGSLVRLPLEIRDGTRERVEGIFRKICPGDTFESICNRIKEF